MSEDDENQNEIMVIRRGEHIPEDIKLNEVEVAEDYMMV